MGCEVKNGNLLFIVLYQCFIVLFLDVPVLARSLQLLCVKRNGVRK